MSAPAVELVERLRGRALQQARADLFREHPYCQRCEDAGRQTQATIRKHILPIPEGGTEDPSNILALCLDCAEAQAAIDGRRGVPSYGLTDAFRKSATPRDAAGQFSVRRATRLLQPDADTPVEGKPGVYVTKTSTSVFAKKKKRRAA